MTATATTADPRDPVNPHDLNPHDSTDPRDTAARVDALLARMEQLGDSRTRVLAEEIVRALMEFYGAGLARVTRIADADTVRRLAADPHLGPMLAMHGLHPVSTNDRVEQALDQIRARLGDRTPVLAVTGPADDRVVTVRADGQPTSPTVIAAVEGAVAALAPEVGVAVEGEHLAGDLAAGRPLLPVVGVSAAGTADRASRAGRAGTP
ncbi:hypothetical protein Ga0074812_11619 [Parafrankia irregularis]|uniref:Uncharacterized protein n=1 Tax=Parafrankia irregularis TaxID=795642 RepID=A0A0S4QQW9_9ACTN|nr:MULTISPECIES: hypothetical protein [Parafrankia]CUU57991.1 hypothetical protein Ga0074812_11619 [Parafrankia irregularis]